VLSFHKPGGSAVNLRLAAREDIEQLFSLDQACFRPGIAYSKSELQCLVFHPRSRSIIAEDETGIRGFAVLQLMMEKGRRIGHIVTIDVSPAGRRQGTGRLLMDELLRFCREADAGLLRLEVAVDNHGALAFYRLLGFQERGRIRGFYLGKLDALQMVLELPAATAGQASKT
jgi:ribosomal-protein-alanine N-acetyltransferase